jgi:hypothetical protein
MPNALTPVPGDEDVTPEDISIPRRIGRIFGFARRNRNAGRVLEYARRQTREELNERRRARARRARVLGR